jgi:uncharacterized delta-60 repeat protein
VARRGAAGLVGAMVISLVFPTVALGGAGDLDPTFSGDGKQTTDFGFGLSSAAATVLQPDGKIIAVGADDAHFDFALARYNPDGRLDTTFSGDGRQTTEFGGNDSAAGVALQPDGKIMVVGRGGDFGNDFALARYNPNGSLDASFSGDGRQTTDFGGGDAAADVVLQPDGKIVVAGGAGGEFALARYNPNGSLDVSFSGDGRQTTDFGGNDAASGVAIQPDGKTVAVGVASSGSAGDFALARYNSDGSLDATFSGDGRQTTDFAGSDQAKGLVLQGDGKIVAVGFAGEFGTGGGDFALARYNVNGALDTSFSGDGKQTTDFGASFGEGANAVALQGDGKIVAVGDGGGGGRFGDDFALARYNPNGSPDPSFSGDGRQTTDFLGSDRAAGVALQGDGKIVVVGRADFGHFALARYNPNGSLDPSFSGHGKRITHFPGEDRSSGIAVQSDGKIVAVGGAVAIASATDGDFALARYRTSGALDTSFSADGRRTTNFGGDLEQAAAVAVQSDGKLIVVGTTQADFRTDSDFALARYNPNGSLDTSFSGDGRQTTDFGGGDAAAGVALQANGKIVVAGRGGPGGDFALARYKRNGSLDTRFSRDGKKRTDFGGSFDGAAGVALQANGKIVAAGGGGPDGDFALARYNLRGLLDTSFSGDGRQTTDFGGTSDGAAGVAIQRDGKIVAAGRGGPGGDFALARYDLHGSLDSTFSGDGKQRTDFGGFDEANGVALQGNGKIVAVGDVGFGDFALARYDANGSLDASFSGDGKQRTDFGGNDEAEGVALQGDGKIVAEGSGRGAEGSSDFALVRYRGG